VIPARDSVESEPGYVVLEIVDSRWYENPKSKFPHPFVQYLVAWEEYEPEESSWEPFEMLDSTAMQTLVNFHHWYPSKPGDHRVVETSVREKKGRR